MVYLLQTNDTTPGIHTLWPLRSSCVYALVAIVPACGACFGGTQVLFACPKAPRPADSWRRQWRSSTRKKGLKGGRRRKIKGRRGTTVPNPQERPGSLARANHAVPPASAKGPGCVPQSVLLLLRHPFVLFRGVFSVRRMLSLACVRSGTVYCAQDSRHKKR